MEKYKRLFVIWKETFDQLVRKLQSEGKEPLLVAMSRKMPRLIESIGKKFTHFNKYHFVSEHALPYVLCHLNAERQCIVIVDDAIYYGSTINHISGYIQAIKTNAEVYVCPIAISNVVGEFPYAKVMRLNENTILERNIPFFTTRNAVQIIKLSRPIDVEFPILHFSFPSSVNWKQKMMDSLSNHFHNCEVYEIVHRIGKEKDFIYNYNVLPEQGSEYDRWNKDFCKLRFFVSDQSAHVVAYAPGILPETVIDDPQPLFSDERIQSLWADIQAYETAAWPESSVGDWTIDLKRDIYNKQCARSKIVWANYLASFLYMLVQKKIIQKVIKEVFDIDPIQAAAISEEDTQLLLPPEKVKYITAELNRYIRDERNEYGIFHGLQSSVLANQELIPAEYKDAYTEKIQRCLQRSSTADEALSLLFSSQHFFISNGGLTNDALQRTQRLRFGITYTALENKLAFPVGIQGLWQSIHRWIDKNIDEGTVKPKYERVIVDGNAYWLRMFRAGENEDSFTKLRRLCDFIIGKLRQKESRSYVERNNVENLLSLAWEDPCCIVKHDYRWDTFVKQQNGNVFSLDFLSPSGKQKKFLDILLEQNYLQNIQEPTSVTRLAALDDSQTATMLTSTQEQAISDYVDVYWDYAMARKQPNIMNNFFQKTGENTLAKEHDRLTKWCEEFSVFMATIAHSEHNQVNSLEEYDHLNELLNDIIGSTVKVSDIAIGDLKNDNRNKINNHIHSEDTNKYTEFKKELLVAAVVQELFEQIFLNPEEKESANTLEGYLDLIQEDEGDGEIVREFLHLSNAEQEVSEKRKKVADVLQIILKEHVK